MKTLLTAASLAFTINALEVDDPTNGDNWAVYTSNSDCSMYHPGTSFYEYVFVPGVCTCMFKLKEGYENAITCSEQINPFLGLSWSNGEVRMS